MKNEVDKRKERFDIVNFILEECILAYPVSSFVISLYKQYQKRGSLSKAQLQGLYAKASDIKDLNPGRLATLLALIQRMPTRYKSDLPGTNEEILPNKDADTLEKILGAFPQHKGARLLHEKLQSGIKLSPRESADIVRFSQLLKNNENI